MQKNSLSGREAMMAVAITDNLRHPDNQLETIPCLFNRLRINLWPAMANKVTKLNAGFDLGHAAGGNVRPPLLRNKFIPKTINKMKTSINGLHHMETDWLRELEFYKDELGILTRRLEEIATKNTGKDILVQVEHFQNRFIILKQQYNSLHKENTERSGRLDQLAKVRPEHIDEKFLADKDAMHDSMRNFVNSFQDTRQEFNRFLSKVM